MLPREKLLLVTKIAIGHLRPFFGHRRFFNEQIQKVEAVRILQKSGVGGLTPRGAQIAQKFVHCRIEQQGATTTTGGALVVVVVVAGGGGSFVVFAALGGQEMQVRRRGQRLDEFQFQLEAIVGQRLLLLLLLLVSFGTAHAGSWRRVEL